MNPERLAVAHDALDVRLFIRPFEAARTHEAKYPEDGFETSRPERSITVCLKVPRALVVDFRKALSLASEPVASVFPAARAAADARQSPMMKVRRVSSVI